MKSFSTYYVFDSRYAEGMKLVRTPGNKDFLSVEGRECQKLKARWSGREIGWIMSPVKVRKLETELRRIAAGKHETSLFEDC